MSSNNSLNQLSIKERTRQLAGSISLEPFKNAHLKNLQFDVNYQNILGFILVAHKGCIHYKFYGIVGKHFSIGYSI